jgi:hypothetical protein
MSSYFFQETEEEEKKYIPIIRVIACSECEISIEGDHFDGCSKLSTVSVASEEELDQPTETVPQKSK